MSGIHSIPADWIADAGLQNFAPTKSAFRCDMPHRLIAIADIEPPMRSPGVILDANGFRRDRMMRILEGIRADDAIPPIDVEISDPGQRPFRLRGGFHRFYASLTCGFWEIPVDVVPRLD
jgi:hypothetical protein